MLANFISEALKLTLGLLFWTVVFFVDSAIFFDVRSRIDNLWLKERNPYLVETLMGEIAFRPRNRSLWSQLHLLRRIST